MRALLATAFALALLLPPFLVGVCAWLWHSTLAHPWSFVAIGLCLLYAMSAYLMTRQFRSIGMTGQRSSEGRSRLDQVLRREAVSSLALFLLAAAVALGLLRLLLA